MLLRFADRHLLASAARAVDEHSLPAVVGQVDPEQLTLQVPSDGSAAEVKRLLDRFADLVPGIILLCAGFGAATTAVSISTDLAEGIVDRFRTMAIARSAVLTGHVAESLIRNLITTGLVIVVAIALGFRPTAEPLRWLAALGVIAMFVLALSWLAAALGLIARNPEAANGFTFAFMFLPYVSSAFVPTASMPSWLHAFAENQPVTPVIETVRGLLMGTPIGDSALLAMLWCAGIAVAGYLAAGALFRRRTRT
ncbi:ABC transporter permease [Nocardia xishanensis]